MSLARPDFDHTDRPAPAVRPVLVACWDWEGRA